MLNQNIKITYFLALVSQLFFPIASWLFFFAQYLNFQQIAVMTAVGGVFSILLEVPTGALADMIGRKKTIAASYFIWSITMFLTAYTQSYFAFLILAAVNGLVNALYSGSFEAIIYDSLKENHKENEFEAVISKIESLTWIGLFVGSIVGGWLFSVWFRLPYIAQGLITLLAGIAALFLIEPKLDSRKYHWKNIVSQNARGFKEIFSSWKVIRLTLIFIVIGAGYDVAGSIMGISQAREYGLEPKIIGVLFALGYLFSAIFSRYYSRLRQSFGSRWLLMAATGLLLSSFFLAKFAGLIIGMILIFLRIASSTTFRNTRSIVMNQFISSQNRATALSSMSLLTQLPYVVMSYFIGGWIDRTSPNEFAFYLGVVILTALLAVQLFFILFNYFRDRGDNVVNVF